MESPAGSYARSRQPTALPTVRFHPPQLSVLLPPLTRGLTEQTWPRPPQVGTLA
jgi:hypothetical protein